METRKTIPISVTVAMIAANTSQSSVHGLTGFVHFTSQQHEDAGNIVKSQTTYGEAEAQGNKAFSYTSSK